MSQKLELSNEKIFNVHSFSALNNMNISIVLYGTTLSEVESEFTKENLTMIRKQYQREVVESFLFVDKPSLQEKKFYDFQITYYFEYLPNKQVR